jgi:hypothetical protein
VGADALLPPMAADQLIADKAFPAYHRHSANNEVLSS